MNVWCRARRLLAVLVVTAGCAQADMVEMAVTRDATIYSDVSALPLANGSGQYLFAGVNGPNNDGNVRRAMLYFDVLGVLPVGALVTSATLRVTVDRVPFGAPASDIFLHRATAGWGEGPSDPTGLEGTGATALTGDATWTDSFLGVTAWATPGGDFDAAASASLSAGDVGAYFFAAPQMVADINAWLLNPAANLGWFMVGDETGSRNARRFISGDLGDPDAEPLLVLGFVVVPEPGVLGLVLAGVMTLVARRIRRGAGSRSSWR